MTKNRISIPQKIRDQVLREFNHSCALCGAKNPHVHHIDENPSNNVPENLLPLCPNCHLIDQHNPTAAIDIDKLKLFRRFKDPVLLSPQFEPLFQRLRFLDNVGDDSNVKELQTNSIELIEFVEALQMGSFYGKQLTALLKMPSRAYSISLEGRDYEYERKVVQHHQEYREQLRQNREQVYSLAVELLRYQPWVVENRG